MRENSYLGAPSTVVTFLFVRDLAISTDCEKRLEAVTLLPSTVVYLITSLLSLWSFLSPFTLSMLSLFTFEAK